MVKGGKGPKWTTEQDRMLCDFIKQNGVGRWDYVAKEIDIGKTGSSCRLRWYNHLDPSIARTNFTDAEERQILLLHHNLGGNKWSEISREMPGRPDNTIKNYWNTHLTKKAKVLHLDVASLDFLIIMIQRYMEKMKAEAAAAELPAPTWELGDQSSYDFMVTSNCDLISQIDHGGPGCTNCYVSDPDFCTCFNFYS